MSDPLEVRVDGKTWRFSRLRLGELRQIEDAARRTASPFDEALSAISRTPVAPEVAKALLDEARVASRGWGRIGTAGFDVFLRSAEGLVRAAELSLRIGHPSLEIDQAQKIAESLLADQLQSIMTVVVGGGEASPSTAEAPTESPAQAG